MRPPLLSFVFFIALSHASTTSIDDLPSAISDILEDRNLIPINAKFILLVNKINQLNQMDGFFYAQHAESLILKFDVVTALWENSTSEYVLRDSYFEGIRFNNNIRLDNGIVEAPDFGPWQRIIHIEQSKNDNSTHFEYATQLYKFLSESLVKIKSGDDFHLFQGTALESWHNLEIMRYSNLRLGKLFYCTGDNSIYLELSHFDPDWHMFAFLVEVRPLGHFEANRTVFVESFNVSQMVFTHLSANVFDVLVDPTCGASRTPRNFSDDYYKWCDDHMIICVPRDEDAEPPFGSITTTSLMETRVAKSQGNYVVETAEEEFFARFPNKTSALFKVPESGVFLLRCPVGTVFWFPKDTVVKRFVCEDETIDDIEIVDLRPKRHWIREDPIGNWTEDEAKSSKICMPSSQTEGEGTSGVVIAMVCFPAVALVAVVGGVWKWRMGREQNEEGGNDVEKTEHENRSNRNSNSDHTHNNVNFVEE